MSDAANEVLGAGKPPLAIPPTNDTSSSPKGDPRVKDFPPGTRITPDGAVILPPPALVEAAPDPEAHLVPEGVSVSVTKQRGRKKRLHDDLYFRTTLMEKVDAIGAQLEALTELVTRPAPGVASVIDEHIKAKGKPGA